MDSLLIPANHNIFWGKITFCALSFSFGVYTNNPEHVLLGFCGATFSQYLSNKNHDSLRVAFHRVLRYIVIYLFIEWSERASERFIWYCLPVAWVTLQSFYSIVKAWAWFEWRKAISHLWNHAVLSNWISIPQLSNTKRMKKKKKNLIYLVLRNTFSSCQYCINLYQINNSLGIHSCNFYLYMYM